MISRRSVGELVVRFAVRLFEWGKRIEGDPISEPVDAPIEQSPITPEAAKLFAQVDRQRQTKQSKPLEGSIAARVANVRSF